MGDCVKLQTRDDLIKKIDRLGELQRMVATEQGQINKVFEDTERYLDEQKRKAQRHKYNVSQTFAEIEKVSKECQDSLLAVIN